MSADVCSVGSGADNQPQGCPVLPTLMLRHTDFDAGYPLLIHVGVGMGQGCFFLREISFQT